MEKQTKKLSLYFSRLKSCRQNSEKRVTSYRDKWKMAGKAV